MLVWTFKKTWILLLELSRLSYLVTFLMKPHVSTGSVVPCCRVMGVGEDVASERCDSGPSRGARPPTLHRPIRDGRTQVRGDTTHLSVDFHSFVLFFAE